MIEKEYILLVKLPCFMEKKNADAYTSAFFFGGTSGA